MSFENPFTNPAPESEQKGPERRETEVEKQPVSKRSGKTLGGWVKKQAALAGAVGLGFLGSMQETAAAPPAAEKGGGPKTEHREETAGSDASRAPGRKISWGVTHLKEESVAGSENRKEKESFAELWFKANKRKTPKYEKPQHSSASTTISLRPPGAAGFSGTSGKSGGLKWQNRR